MVVHFSVGDGSAAVEDTVPPTRLFTSRYI